MTEDIIKRYERRADIKNNAKYQDELILLVPDLLEALKYQIKYCSNGTVHVLADNILKKIEELSSTPSSTRE